MNELRLALVGAGRLGTALTLALIGSGATLTGFASGSAASRGRGADLFHRAATESVEQLVATALADGADLLLLAVPDGVLPTVAAQVGRALADARNEPTGGRRAAIGRLVVAHTSGASSIDVLAPCRRAGAAILGFHPLQTFSDPLSGIERLRGCAVAVTTDDPRAAAFAAVVAGAVGARPFVLADEHRALYHAAAVVASNYLVTLASVAESLFERAGLPAGGALPAFLPLMRGALHNMEAQGTVAALTGPLSRGDVGTVAAHLEALAREAPETVDFYRALGHATLPLLRARADVPIATIDRLDDLLESMSVRSHCPIDPHAIPSGPEEVTVP